MRTKQGKQLVMNTIYKNMSIRRYLVTAFAAIAALTMTAPQATAQTWNQSIACPGWNNPSNFSSGGTRYTGGVGSKNSNQCPNVMTGVTGVTSLPGVTTNTGIKTAAQLDGSASPIMASTCSNASATIPNQNRQFAIMTSLTGTDPNTGGGLKYVPTQFNTTDTTANELNPNTQLTSSIRIGDGCANSGASAAGLYYTFRVTAQNAMFYLYYAIVAQAPTHGMQGNPAFIARVMKRNSAGQWNQVSDTLAYYITTTPSSNNSNPCAYMQPVVPGTNGWSSYGSGYDPVYYKQWEKVAINLSNHIYDTVQIQIVMYDCVAEYHYAYAYIAGECRQMKINASGCPAGMSTNVATLSAPKGLQNYVWYASEWGVADDPPSVSTAPGGAQSHFTFRRLTDEVGTPESRAFDYAAQAEDFRITRARNAAGQTITIDSMGNEQTFMCEMTSALDPAKPFTSRLYANLTNQKPSMIVDTLYNCDGDVKVWNMSEVPGDPTLVVRNATQWSVFGTPDCIGTPIGQYTGDSVLLNFTDSDPKGLLVRTQTIAAGCYSEAIYPILPRINPKAGFVISEKVLCDDGETTITDTTSGDNRRVWSFLPANAPEGDTNLVPWNSDASTIVRSFTHAVEPIQLQVYNGLYTIYRGDTSWCNAVARDTVAVFLHPELEVTGDTIVCAGSRTNATVRAVGVEGCTYEWSLTPGQVTGGLPAGPTLQVVPYADKATYYVKVTSPQGCVAWDSIHAYLVRPKLAIVPPDGRICPDMTATLIGSDADHYSWTASPADPSLAGQENNAQITVSPAVTTTYTMIGHGTNDCDATPLTEKVTIVPLPVPEVKVTPGYIDSDNPTVTLRDASRYSIQSEWAFEDGAAATGREVKHTFDGVIGRDSMGVVLTAYNELQCAIQYPFAIPVNLFTAWFPNAFTPGSQDDNAYFSFFSINDYEYFHIYIYNRRGELVYESDDVKFRWDGTRLKDGEPLEQGTYVYTCRFRKPGSTVLNSHYGSVTLIR